MIDAPLVDIRAVGKFGKVTVLDGTDLEVKRGEVVTIIGPSGSGKTTLLRCVNLLETYDTGTIRIDGVELGYREQGGVRRLRRERDLARVRKMGKAEARMAAMHWLERVGLAERAGHLPSQLSGGQQQRVGIARAVAMGPKILLLDEITSALDPELVGEFLAAVRGLAADGMTMLVVTHEMGFAREVSDRIVFMDRGRIQVNYTPEEVLRHASHERLRAFLSRIN
jgi:polar amino acid transport system ATP-binding protein